MFFIACHDQTTILILYKIQRTLKHSVDNMSYNPLLESFAAPNQAPPFDRIKPEQFIPALEKAIEQARDNIEEIKNNDASPDFDNTIVALETCDETLGQIMSIYGHLLNAIGGDDFHDLAAKIGPMASNFSSDIILDPELFERIKSVYDQRGDLDLTAEQATLLEETYVGFVRGGAMLDESKKERFREISEELSLLGPDFMKNVSKSSEEFQLFIDNEEDLSGLPEGVKNAAREAAEEEGEPDKWLFTLDISTYLPFIQYADNRDLREKMWRGFFLFSYEGEHDNQGNIKKIISLRHERANLLGYNTHADFVLERRMAEKRENVESFLQTLKEAYKQAAIHDLQALKTLASERDGITDIKPWDVGYYGEKLKEITFQFSSEDVRPYFQLKNVLNGVFTHFSKLFGLKFTTNADYPVWHEDVTAYDVHDESDGRFIGTFYTDFHPRKGKKDGAWKFGLRSQGLYKGKIERPIIGIVCNFTKPGKDTPSLLTHNEVSTLFHEMGHAIHGLVSDVTYPSLAGTSVKWDFVELPSQVQENWCFKKETLDLFAAHYETGAKMPQELIDKLYEAKNFMVGWGGLRQINFATLDMAWHTSDPEQIDDVAGFEDMATAETSLFPRMAGPFSTGFNHIFAGGYAAGYYSYKWAEVLDADAFEVFLERGLYDKETAQIYRDEVLSKGGSEHPKILYRRFRGRDADPNALLRREGLLASDTSSQAAAE